MAKWIRPEDLAWYQESSDGGDWYYRGADPTQLTLAIVTFESTLPGWVVAVWDGTTWGWKHEGLARTLESAMKMAVEALMLMELDL